MKVILTASRNPALDRPGFFRYLRAVHWPLVASFPEVLAAIRRYTQNHTFLPDEDGGVPTPWRRAVERDSVIEVWFDGPDGLDRMNAAPGYASEVSPDEARFNDLASNVLLAAREEMTHTIGSVGRVRRFDFLYARPDFDPLAFGTACSDACRALALDPLFQALADMQTLHLPLDPERRAGTTPQAVVATAASSLDAIGRLAAPRFVQGFAASVDHERSFSVLATSFAVHPGMAP